MYIWDPLYQSSKGHPQPRIRYQRPESLRIMRSGHYLLLGSVVLPEAIFMLLEPLLLPLSLGVLGVLRLFHIFPDLLSSSSFYFSRFLIFLPNAPVIWYCYDHYYHCWFMVLTYTTISGWLGSICLSV